MTVVSLEEYRETHCGREYGYDFYWSEGKRVCIRPPNHEERRCKYSHHVLAYMEGHGFVVRIDESHD